MIYYYFGDKEGLYRAVLEEAYDRIRSFERSLDLAALPPREAPALSLQFEGDSWARVIGPDGRLLEQALLHAGDRRNYAAGEVGAVVLGNAGAVRVSSHGREADLAPYLRANVARFTVSSEGSLAPAAD
jgi:cytoskeleton protein RodZ